MSKPDAKRRRAMIQRLQAIADTPKPTPLHTPGEMRTLTNTTIQMLQQNLAANTQAHGPCQP